MRGRTPLHRGRLELTWTDKDRALLPVGDGKYDYTFVDPTDWRISEIRLLHEVDRVEADTPPEYPETLPTPTHDNLLVTGDAMHVLDALAKIPAYADEYLGKVKLVYIDPPFNTGQTFANYEDNIEHSLWLTMLRDRLRQIKPLLTDDGSVWVHLDHVESHRCRAVLDEEFGPENFVGEVAWQKTTSPNNDTNRISVSHDVILVYRKTSQWRPNRLDRLASSNTSRYKSRDGDPIPWRDGDATAAGARSNDETSIYAIQHPVTGGLLYPPPGRHWAMNQAWMLQQLLAWAPYELRDICDEAKRGELRGLPANRARAGVQAIMLAVPLEEAAAMARDTHANHVWPDLVFLNLDQERIQRKKHLVDQGRVPETLWMLSDVGGTQRAKNQISALFPGERAFATPKPEELMQRVIRIATDPGDIVLDCFAGSGTTAAVAHKMGRRWVTSELRSETARTFAKPRLIKVVRGEDEGGISTVSERAADGPLPTGMRAHEAFVFQQSLRKVLGTTEDTLASDHLDGHELGGDQGDLDDATVTEPLEPLTIEVDKELAQIARRHERAGDGPLTADETKTLLALVRRLGGSVELDLTAMVKRNLNSRTRTKETKTRVWFGGGGFAHLEVGPSMFTEAAGMLLLANWATQTELSRVICAQLSVRYQPDGIFAGREGRTRYVVIDGMVGASTVEAIIDRLEERQVVEVWATQLEEGAIEVLRKLRPGSSLHAIPAAVLDSYRRKKTATSPFRQQAASEEGEG